MCPQGQMPRRHIPFLTDLHTSLVHIIFSLLSLKDVLRFESCSSSCQRLVKALPKATWKAVLGNCLPAHHALLDGASQACGRAAYCRTQRDL